MRHGLDLTVERYGRHRHLRVKTAVLAAVCALLAGLGVWRLGPGAVAWLAAVPGRVERAVGDWLMPHYTARLGELTRQNAGLRSQLAACANLRTENAALRSLLQSPAAEQSLGSRPMAVAERWTDGFSLAGSAPAGRAVLDARGRYAGRTAAPDPDRPGLLPVQNPSDTPCLADGRYGLLSRQGGRWYLTGLPRHAGLSTGTVVTTADGWWVGRLAAPPAEDETGLCSRALLTDTADLMAELYFVAPAGS